MYRRWAGVPFVLVSLGGCGPSASSPSAVPPGQGTALPSLQRSEQAGPSLLPPPIAVAGNRGALAWSGAELPEDTLVERSLGDGGWEVLATEDGLAWDERGSTRCRYRLYDPDSGSAGPSTLPSPLDLRIDGAPEPPLVRLWEEVQLHVQVNGPGVPLPELRLYVARERGDELRYLDGSCASEQGEADDSCWTETPVAATELELDPVEGWSWSLPRLPSEPEAPALTRYVLGLAYARGGTLYPLAERGLELVETGTRLYWGDLHAHSNLSFDGCEDEDEECRDRGAGPGEGFFDEAVANGLDFAALTDHAEYTDYYPDGEDGELIDIWERAQELVEEAESRHPGFVPILGYEFTFTHSYDDGHHFRGGHRHVLFDSPTACIQRRIGRKMDASGYIRPVGSGVFTNSYPELMASSVADFYDALEAGATECGESSRVLVIPHHTALPTPRPLDWTAPENAPRPEYTPVMEIYSEHGCSECRDPEAEDCEWRTFAFTERYPYEPRGSAQTALSMGYHLGFVGGTDSHDARPGSVTDGASCVSRTSDEDGDGIYDDLICHRTGGGLTGAMVPGHLDRESLFDAIFARHTLATSGPRPDIAVAVKGADGQVYLPGDEVPVDATPLELLFRSSEAMRAAGVGFIEAALVDPSNRVLFRSEKPDFRVELDVNGGDVFYLRLRLDVDGEEERIWISPFFVD